MGMTAQAAGKRQMLDDRALVELARSGDEGAIGVLIQRHNRRLFRVTRGVVRDDDEAEDIVQETYLRAFTNLNGFRGEASLATWLTRIALNEAFGRLRRRRPSVDISEMESGRVPMTDDVILFPGASRPANPESEAGRAQMRQMLEQAVDELPEPFRLVFILREIEGCSTEQTAAQLSIRPETAKTRLHRARRLLRRTLERRVATTFSELFPFAGARCARVADRVIKRLRTRQS